MKKPFEYWFHEDDNYSEGAANEYNKDSQRGSYKLKIHCFVEVKYLDAANLEIAEWKSKYNFMVDSAQLNAKDRDIAITELTELQSNQLPNHLHEIVRQSALKLNEENNQLKEKLQSVRATLVGLSIPCTRTDYTVAKLDAVVSSIADEAITLIDEEIKC